MHNDTEPSAALYARVSSDAQAADDKVSLGEQLAALKDHCRDRGIEVADVFQDIAPGSTARRPAFQAMLEGARKGRFNTIIAWKADRLSRGIYPAAALLEVVESHGVTLDTVAEPFSMATFGLMAAIGKVELDSFRERARMGKRGAAKAGKAPIGSVPFGYAIAEDGRLEIVPDDAAAVAALFAAYVNDGKGTAEIARELEARTGRRWHSSHIHRMLANSAYKGLWMYGKTTSTTTERGRRVVEVPREDWIGIDCPAIVDAETWEAAQARKVQRRNQARRNQKVFYALKSLVLCAECGATLRCRSARTGSVRRGENYYYYDYDTPRRYYRCVNRCRNYIRADTLEEFVWQQVSALLMDPGTIAASLDAAADTQVAAELERERADAQRQLDRIERENSMLVRLALAEKITESEFDREREAIDGRMSATQDLLTELEARARATLSARAAAEAVVDWAATFGDRLDELTPEERREVLMLACDHITIDAADKVTIRLAIGSATVEPFVSPVSSSTARYRERSPTSTWLS